VADQIYQKIVSDEDTESETPPASAELPIESWSDYKKTLERRISILTRPARFARKILARSRARSAAGFCPLQAMFSLEFLALCKIGYQVIGWCNAIEAIDKSDWQALPCPRCVRVTR
jgi:hypothetical protein